MRAGRGARAQRRASCPGRRHRRGAAALAWLAALAGASTIAAADDWSGPDKRLHGFYGAFAGIGAYEVAAAFDAPPWLCATSAAGAGLVLGAGKELWDARGHGDPSLRDAVWTVAPALVVGGVLAWLHTRQREAASHRARPPPQRAATTGGSATTPTPWRSVARRALTPSPRDGQHGDQPDDDTVGLHPNARSRW